MPCEHEDDSYLAVGLSDNSVCLWDISRSNMVAEVKCPGSDFFVKVSECKLQQKQQREQQEIVDLTMGNNELGKDSESLTFHPETWNPMWSVARCAATGFVCSSVRVCF
ncbi:uncharacterized protein LOC131254846 [Magnolia sinica]|uniref:uncharacterized protein LOC131254846 n=1 Tax=Magnolia sinica TaxID=86752 RepID=UPI00265A2F72|nr:uncharacterized protein LOC131254846 [Magnolia sinica]